MYVCGSLPDVVEQSAPGPHPDPEVLDDVGVRECARQAVGGIDVLPDQWRDPRAAG
jgi:hypothetical protein